MSGSVPMRRASRAQGFKSDLSSVALFLGLSCWNEVKRLLEQLLSQLLKSNRFVKEEIGGLGGGHGGRIVRDRAKSLR